MTDSLKISKAECLTTIHPGLVGHDGTSAFAQKYWSLQLAEELALRLSLLSLNRTYPWQIEQAWSAAELIYDSASGLIYGKAPLSSPGLKT